jgi:hypothetical protein
MPMGAKQFWTAMVAICGLAAAAQAATVTPSLYRVDGKPVPASCLEAVANGDKAIDLTHCGNPKLRPKIQGDTIGYDIPEGGYFYYRYLGQADGLAVLYMESSGGGSGQFTMLSGVRQDGHLVRKVRDYGAGDRCNGGLSEAAVSNGRLTFDQALTPYDLIALANPKTKLDAYKDLEASATSCVAVSHMVGDDKHWTGVTLTEDALTDEQGWTSQYRYQSCFNKLYTSWVKQDRDDMDRGGVMAFANAFVSRCVQPAHKG